MQSHVRIATSSDHGWELRQHNLTLRLVVLRNSQFDFHLVTLPTLFPYMSAKKIEQQPPRAASQLRDELACRRSCGHLHTENAATTAPRIRKPMFVSQLA
jgi:hypothetical protein